MRCGGKFGTLFLAPEEGSCLNRRAGRNRPGSCSRSGQPPSATPACPVPARSARRARADPVACWLGAGALEATGGDSRDRRRQPDLAPAFVWIRRGRAGACDRGTAASSGTRRRPRRGICRLAAQRGAIRSSSARSASLGCHLSAATLALICSGRVAPAITEATAGCAARPAIATSRTLTSRASA
jgi:hypothetical protein